VDGSLQHLNSVEGLLILLEKLLQMMGFLSLLRQGDVI